MKKYLFLTTISLLIVNSLFFSSCKKITHPPHPSPGGVRLASYSTIGTSVHLNPAGPSYTENANYAFSYDALNRVIFIVYTTNDAFKPDEDMSFVYYNDTIIKTTTAINPGVLIEIDTFIVNNYNQIIKAYTPNTYTTFQYYGKLLTIQVVTNEATGEGVTTSYTSQSGNFLTGTTQGSATASVQNFTFYTNTPNTIGDYLQIGSFTMYGSNVYQYTNLLNTITVAGGSTTTASYNMDAYSNITTTTVSVVDKSANDTTTTYNFQYENY